MGPHSKPQVPNLLPGVLNALADSKPNIRQAALATINTFLQETSLRDMFINEIFFTALSKGNPFVKQEIFMWMATKLPEGKGIPKDELSVCLPILYSGIEDRSAEVRKATQEAVPGFMKHLGFEAMRKATDKLSAVSKNGVMPLLEKARAETPPSKAGPPRPNLLLTRESRRSHRNLLLPDRLPRVEPCQANPQFQRKRTTT